MPTYSVVVEIPTAHDDPLAARRAVAPYLRDMRVVAHELGVVETPADDAARARGFAAFEDSLRPPAEGCYP